MMENIRRTALEEEAEPLGMRTDLDKVAPITSTCLHGSLEIDLIADIELTWRGEQRSRDTIARTQKVSPKKRCARQHGRLSLIEEEAAAAATDQGQFC